jgi:regulator of CtrA degradation
MSALPSANPRIIEALYEEALLLADRARCEFENLRRRIADHGPDAQPTLGDDRDLIHVQVSCEALRTTTRIMHCLAWLLNHRAWFAGELNESQLRRHGRLIAHFPGTDPACVVHLPPAAQVLVHESERLYQRLGYLDRAWQAQGAQACDPMPAALARLRERLGVALAEAG